MRNRAWKFHLDTFYTFKNMMSQSKQKSVFRNLRKSSFKVFKVWYFVQNAPDWYTTPSVSLVLSHRPFLMALSFFLCFFAFSEDFLSASCTLLSSAAVIPAIVWSPGLIPNRWRNFLIDCPPSLKLQTALAVQSSTTFFP